MVDEIDKLRTDRLLRLKELTDDIQQGFLTSIIIWD